MNAIELHDVALEGLAGFSFTLGPGDQVALCGEHQESLTKLIRACVGLERVDAGSVRVLGVDVVAATRHELVQLRRRIGYVSIAGGLLSNMSLRENIALGLRYRGRSDAEARGIADALLHQVELQAYADERACTVPAELQKCCAYARALATEPELVLVEDPSAFLHPKGREAVAALHRVLSQRGIPTLIADDDVEFCTRLADRVVAA
jgi:ABC-type polar amino acid transport system ATPase subunit